MTTTDAGPQPSALREQVATVQPGNPRQRNLSLAFDRLVETWDDRAAHQAFVYEATQADELAFTGTLYRAVLERWPEDAMALAAKKQIATSAVFAGGLGSRGAASQGPKLPPWVFLSGGMSLAWIAFDLTTQGTFSLLDAAMVAVCVGSIGYAVYKLRQS